VNELAPVGLRTFSEGDTVVGGVVATVVVAVVGGVVGVVEVDGDGFCLFAHPAAIAPPIATTAAPRVRVVRKRLAFFELMIHILSVLVDLAAT
jgi:hypothetical protein